VSDFFDVVNLAYNNVQDYNLEFSWRLYIWRVLRWQVMSICSRRLI